MLSHVFRLARPAARLNLLPKSTATTSTRSFTVSAARKSGHPSPQLLGEGGKAGEVPTDITQSTGLERLQTLGFLEGVDVFDHEPLDSSRIGTLDNPVLVYSLVRSFLLFFGRGLWVDIMSVFRMLSVLWGARGLLRILMILGGTIFIRINCFVVGNAVPVSSLSCCSAPLRVWRYSSFPFFFSVYKLDYHGPEEGEHDNHH